MYRCTECGIEYEIKPDYCDCGNDTFENIVIEDDCAECNKLQEHLEKNIQDNGKDVNVYKKEKINNNLTKDIYKSIDLLSIGIFLLCIILSLIVVLFIWNPKEQPKNDINSIEKTEIIIPDIDTFWDNSLPKVLPSVKKEITKSKAKDITTSTVHVSKPKVIRTNEPKKVRPSQKLVVQKTVSPKKVEEIQAIKPQEKKVVKSINTKIIPTKVSPIDNQILVDYKINLRNNFGRRIDFTQVVGDGDCSVSFKISSTGNIINRSFTKQSDNITLNDAVYRAVMSLPTFNPPPISYKNEILTLYVKIYNGNFEIDLK